MAERKALHGYTDAGVAKVLAGAGDLVRRAESLFRATESCVTPPLVAAAWRKEADLCLAEAEELIARVREVRPA